MVRNGILIRPGEWVGPYRPCACINAHRFLRQFHVSRAPLHIHTRLLAVAHYARCPSLLESPVSGDSVTLLLSGFGGELGWCRDNMEKDTIYFAPRLAHVVPAPWHNGKAVLIGDAAHATPPHIGHGAAHFEGWKNGSGNVGWQSKSVGPCRFGFKLGCTSSDALGSITFQRSWLGGLLPSQSRQRSPLRRVLPLLLDGLRMLFLQKTLSTGPALLQS